MKIGKVMAWGLVAPLVGVLGGCAGGGGNMLAPTPTQTTAQTPAQTPAKTPASATADDGGKAEKKISMAIGREVGTFALASRQAVDAPVGYVGTQYTVKTTGGETYKCEILEPSGLGRIATWGMASGASAMCTNFTEGSRDRGKTNKAGCNDLLRAANKC